jgi:hypothetical protein
MSAKSLTEALKPFLTFANMLQRLPEDFQLTRGSHMAARQLTVRDFRDLLAAAASTPAEPAPMDETDLKEELAYVQAWLNSTRREDRSLHPEHLANALIKGKRLQAQIAILKETTDDHP